MSGALVIGGGPAGLMAADALLSAGHAVVLAEAKPSLGRKFLMAGKSGLNLTKAEPLGEFLAQYGAAAPALHPMLSAFPPEEVMHWAEGLGQSLFTGSTGRVFPHGMKASPLLRAWLARLDGMGLERHMRWRWTGWDDDHAGAVLMDTPDGALRLTPDVTVLALGGASWARLGSDGQWADIFSGAGLPVTPFAPANAGLCVDWSAHMKAQFGAPLKGVAFHAGDLVSRGEAVISARGLEGGGLYPLSPALRAGAALTVDLCPDVELATLTKRLSRPRGKQSLSNHLRKVVSLSPAGRALLMECARPLPEEPAALAALLKALPVPHAGLRPIDEAISVAGGVPFAALDAGLMLKDRPGVFVAGEMLDWEAPTGGYLLTGCLATGLWAGRAAAERLNRG
ncbi:aminoacetone oxidase family FAD-binding enzyme [Alloyangia pacifica]|uniref:Aminoacetone oxidase family FAD-binding enzyme n=1 Tax=Alloyangia pacifica TaxID=311180 RepID=A0A2U8HG30_9RHOB|nr:TIGR03862 family flavoprotein [Alloyangia pacifica]AWI84771.1 aminoacetone oxidase family FAD-binding enzyme [Alloyangia pacifica]